LTGIRVIRAFNREDREREKAKKATMVMADNIIKGNITIGIITPLSIMLLNLIVVVILYIGTMKMQKPDSLLSAGDILAVIEYVAFAMIGIINITFSIAMFPHAQVSYRRICEVLDAESIPPSNDIDLPPLKGNIRFDNVGFIFENALDPAVAEISLEIKSGDKIAFIGGTGAGKSTIANLLMGFYPRSTGEIYYDDVPMKDISVQRVRKNISCVLQKATIFEGSIRSNIELGKPGASEEEILESVKTSQILDFVKEQKEGLDYPIQPIGANLSGGQKQRISIARALLKDATIYLFDDSFSALDFLTESRIRIRLAKLLAGKTQIYITQRVASAMTCDKIYVIDKGKIVASGKHKELLSESKIYREIYNSQTGGNNNE
jgi:ABC-type multidrug transport system fused ATPase/permease subunit